MNDNSTMTYLSTKTDSSEPLEATLERQLEQQLRSYGVMFRQDGLPEFPNDQLLRELPPDIDMMTFANRNYVESKEHTLICSFATDNHVLRRMKHIEQDLPAYQEFLGFCGFDLSPRGGMSIETQRRNIRINAMANTLLALLSGKKMLANFRIGSIETLDTLSLYPKGIPYAVGALGCARGNTEYNRAYLKTKIAYARPSELLIFGRLRNAYREVLEEEQIPYRVFPDYRQRSFIRKAG